MHVTGRGCSIALARRLSSAIRVWSRLWDLDASSLDECRPSSRFRIRRLSRGRRDAARPAAMRRADGEGPVSIRLRAEPLAHLPCPNLLLRRKTGIGPLDVRFDVGCAGAVEQWRHDGCFAAEESLCCRVWHCTFGWVISGSGLGQKLCEPVCLGTGPKIAIQTFRRMEGLQSEVCVGELAAPLYEEGVVGIGLKPSGKVSPGDRVWLRAASLQQLPP